MSAVKITKMDKVFSKLVRERALYHCEVCETYFPEGMARAGLHASHFYGRRKYATRWHPQNVTSQCRGCHQKFTENPRQHTRWFIDKFGSEIADEIEVLSNQIMRWREKDKATLYDSLRAELKDMQAKRMSGETGRLEFLGSKVLSDGT